MVNILVESAMGVDKTILTLEQFLEWTITSYGFYVLLNRLRHFDRVLGTSFVVFSFISVLLLNY